MILGKLRTYWMLAREKNLARQMKRSGSTLEIGGGTPVRAGGSDMHRPIEAWEVNREMHIQEGHVITYEPYHGNTIRVHVNLHDGRRVIYHTPRSFDFTPFSGLGKYLATKP